MSVKLKLMEAKAIAGLQWKSFVVGFIALAAVFVTSNFVEPGIVSWILGLIPAGMIVITSFARVNDIGPEKMGAIWAGRRIAFVLTGAAAVMYIGEPQSYPPSWKSVMMLWGVAGVWFTTPGGVPWWDYVSGRWLKDHKDGKKFSHIAHLTGRSRGELRTEQDNKDIDDTGEL